MHLSDHFRLEEFACGCGCQGHVQVRAALEFLCQATLEPLRKALGGAPVKVTSGYRCPRYNRAVDGAPGSMHLRGWAADVKVTQGQGFAPGLWTGGVAWGLMLACVLPKGGVGTYGRFVDLVHVDCRGTMARWHKGRWPA